MDGELVVLYDVRREEKAGELEVGDRGSARTVSPRANCPIDVSRAIPEASFPPCRVLAVCLYVPELT